MVRIVEDFGTEFKVHGVEMVPCSAPYKSVAAENLDYLAGKSVGIFYTVGFSGVFVFPEPVVGIRHRYVESYAVGVGAEAFSAADRTPVESA